VKITEWIQVARKYIDSGEIYQAHKVLNEIEFLVKEAKKMEVKKDKIINVSKETPLEEGCFRPGDKAKASCNKCYGRGIIGENLKAQSLVICPCVVKALKREEVGR